MRIHTDALMSGDLANIAEHFPSITLMLTDGGFGSRSHDRAYDVRLLGTSRYAPQGMPGKKAATYDEWGNFLSAVFSADPYAKCGDYNGVEDFDQKTNFMFVGGKDSIRHRDNSDRAADPANQE